MDQGTDILRVGDYSHSKTQFNYEVRTQSRVLRNEGGAISIGFKSLRDRKSVS